MHNSLFGWSNAQMMMESDQKHIGFLFLDLPEITQCIFLKKFRDLDSQTVYKTVFKKQLVVKVVVHIRLLKPHVDVYCTST